MTRPAVPTRAGTQPETRGGRLALFLALGAASICVPATLDLGLPALPEIRDGLDTSATWTQTTITAYLLGLSVGQILIGSLSDVYGRRRPFIAGLALYAAASLSCALAPTVAVMIALRPLQGLGAAACLVSVRAMVLDLYDDRGAARYLSRLFLVLGLAPVLAPSIGAQILDASSWRAIFVALAVFGALVTVAVAVIVPETLPPAARRSADVGAMSRTYRVLIRNRQYTGFALGSGLTGAALIAVVTGSSFALQEDYGLSPREMAVAFSSGAVLMIVVAQVNAHAVRRRDPRAIVIGCLVVNLIAATLLVVTTAADLGGAASVIVALVTLVSTWGAISANATALAISEHLESAASAAALVGLMQYGLGAFTTPLVGAVGGSALGMGVLAVGLTVTAIAIVVSLTHRLPATTEAARALAAVPSLPE